MALSAQDKILYVANKLGLSSLNLMQGSTGAVYDVDTDQSSVIFTNASQHQDPTVTNINQNQFEVNEALLVETVGFYVLVNGTVVRNFQRFFDSGTVIVYDLIIGNKRVMKSTPIFAAGSPYTFANVAQSAATIGEDTAQAFLPRHQTYMEGAGVLIPPQVEWSVEYRLFNIVTGLPVALTNAVAIGCYLYGTRVLLNFNTSI